MTQTANITSLAAMQSLRAALVEFDENVRHALVALELESRRPLEWIEHDRTRYWPGQVRKASDALSEARLALARCESAGSGEDRRDCYDERKAVERAKRRLHLADEKVQAVRRWRPKMKKEIEEFLAEVARLRQYLDSDFAQSIAGLARMLESLDRYVAHGPSVGASDDVSKGAVDAGG